MNIAPAACTADPLKTLSDLWAHECLRVFHDRLVSAADQGLVKRELHALLVKRFGSREDYESVFADEAPLLFADFVKLGVPREERAYCKVKGAPSRCVRASADCCGRAKRDAEPVLECRM